VVTAVEAEASAVLAGVPEPADADADTGAGAGAGAGAGSSPEVALPGGLLLRRRGAFDVLAAGAGPAAAAAATATALTWAELRGDPRGESPGEPPYALVVSAGIGGGFAPVAPVAPGSAVVADRILAADLGSETPAAPGGFTDVGTLGFGRAAWTVPAAVTAALADALRRAGLTVAVGPVLTVSTTTGTAESAAALLARHPGAVAEGMEGAGVAEAAARFGLPAAELRTVSNAVGPRDRAAWRIGDALAALERAFAAVARAPAVNVPALVPASAPDPVPALDAPLDAPTEE